MTDKLLSAFYFLLGLGFFFFGLGLLTMNHDAGWVAVVFGAVVAMGTVRGDL